MRKTLLVITVLFVAAQAYGGTVTLSVDDEGGGWAAIRYSADANVSAFGLKVTADSGASFTDINDYNIGECTATVQGYGIFPGTIDINEVTGVVDDNGTPVAPNDAPGAAGTGFGTGALILEMGALYVEPNHPAKSGTLILVEVNGDCNVCVEGEPIRGNVVLTDANEAILAYSPNCVSVTLVTECYAGMADYDQWAEVNKPECWCYPRQCHGDADGEKEGTIPTGYKYVDQPDLDIMGAGWKVKDPPKGSGILNITVNGVPVACGDFAHDKVGTIPTGYKRIDQTDLDLMGAYWKEKEPPKGSGTPADCLPGNCTPGAPCP